MKAIAVIDKNRALGKEGGLIYDIPSDLQHFKAQTLGKTVIMGRKTVEGLPGGRPLPGRNTVIVSASLKENPYEPRGSWTSALASGREETLKLFKDGVYSDPVVCGGAMIYSLFLEDCDELVLTVVEAENTDADAYFPAFEDKFALAEEGPLTEEKGVLYRINKYKRVDK